MVTRQQILDLVNAHLSRVLRVAEAALPKEQFRAFRRTTLDEFGRSGFGRGLARLLDDQQEKKKEGSGWNKPAGKERDHV